MLKLDTDGVGEGINLDLDHLTDHWGSDENRTFSLSGTRTDSHISVSPREVEPSQFYVADILEKRKYVGGGVRAELQSRDIIIYQIECFPSLELQGDLALKRYGITRNVRVLDRTQNCAWCVGISEPFISRTFPRRDSGVVAHYLS